MKKYSISTQLIIMTKVIYLIHFFGLCITSSVLGRWLGKLSGSIAVLVF